MKLLLQQSTEQPQSWVEFDHEDWAQYVAQLKRPLPVGGESLSTPGYLNSLCVMGLYIDGDHYAIEPYGIGGIRMTAWYDDMEDFELEGYDSIVPDGGPRGRSWTFEPMRQIAAKGGMWQPRLTRTVIGSAAYLAEVQHRECPDGRGPPITCSLDPTQYVEFDKFQLPVEELTMHGIWMPKELHDAHENERVLRTWREWTDGVPKELCEGGKLLEQVPKGLYVKPEGTITWILLDDGATADSNHAATNENQMNQTDPASAIDQQGLNLSAGGDVEDFAWQSPAGEPNDGAWTTGDYRVQVDINAAGADLTFGALDLGGSSGHIGRLNSTGTEQETKQQVESAFSGIANHLATTGSVSWTAGAAGDLYHVLWATIRAAGLHGNQRIIASLDQADSFADGPFPAGIDLVRVEDEDVSLEEGVVKTKLIAQAKAEVVDVIEDVVKTKLIVQAVDEVANVVEGIINVLGKIKVVDEVVNSSEDSNKTKLIAKVEAEIVDLVEGLISSRELIRVEDEGENIPEDIVKTKLILMVEDEVENLVEAVINVLGKIKVVDETVNILEELNKTKLIAQIVDEAENVPEAVLPVRVLNRILDEVMNTNEGLVKATALLRIQDEVVDLVEQINEHITTEATGDALLKIINEVVQTNEGKVTIRGLNKILNEPQHIIEDLVKAQDQIRLLTETVSVQEALIPSRALLRIKANISNVVEAINKTIASFKIEDETVELTESVLRFSLTTKIITEAVNLVEGLVKARALIRIKDAWMEIHERVITTRALIRIKNLVMNPIEALIKLVTDARTGVAEGTPSIAPLALGTPATVGRTSAVPGITPRALGTVTIKAL